VSRDQVSSRYAAQRLKCIYDALVVFSQSEVRSITSDSAKLCRLVIGSVLMGACAVADRRRFRCLISAIRA
jgi:hypothetical protein